MTPSDLEEKVDRLNRVLERASLEARKDRVLGGQLLSMRPRVELEPTVTPPRRGFLERLRRAEVSATCMAMALVVAAIAVGLGLTLWIAKGVVWP